VVQAQPYQGPNAPRIDGFNVDEVRRLEPGAELNFDVYGTPGGTVTLRIAGANRNLNLVETEPGHYEGAYTISGRDTLTAESSVTANLRIGNRVASAVLAESLQRGRGYGAYGPQGGPGAPAGAPGNAPRIERFDMAPVASLGGGSELTFTLTGTPGGRAEIAVDGARGTFFLPEVRPGVYTGVYTVRGADRITPSSVVNATLRQGGRVTATTLNRPLLASGPGVPLAPRAGQTACLNCGTVEAVNPIEVSGDGSYLGTVGGGVVGALLGNQVGKGTGRAAATVAGAIGGAYAGRQIERNSNRTNHFEVVVRMARGGTQVITVPNDPQLRVGERVHVDNGALLRGW
jgi:outer membrane lipoprotein SlyB